MIDRKFVVHWIAGLFAALAATPAAGQTLNDQEQLTLANGKAVVRVAPDDRGADGQIYGVIEIPAAPSKVWRVLVDCEHAPKIMANLRSCRVLERADAGDQGKRSWDVREHQIAWVSVLPTVRSVFRSEYVRESSIRFAKADGGDLTALDGEWRLESTQGGAGTRLLYRARFGFLAVVPSFLVRQSMANDFPGFLETIRAEAINLR